MSFNVRFTCCISRNTTILIIPRWPGQKCVRSFGQRMSQGLAQWRGRFLGGWLFPICLEDPQSNTFWSVRRVTCPIGCWPGSWGGFRGWGGKLWGGFLQSPPMPEKLTTSQVGPLVSWSPGRVGRSTRRLGGPWYEGQMYIGEQDWLTGWIRSRSTSCWASAVEHPVYFMFAQIPAHRRDHTINKTWRRV